MVPSVLSLCAESLYKALICRCSSGISGIYAGKGLVKGYGSVVSLICEASALLTLPL